MKITLRSKNKFTKKGGEKKMKYSKIVIALVAAGLALGTYITSHAAEDVRSSKHNLATNPNILATGTTEVCIYCHTPHGGRSDVAGGAAPIWNRSLSTATYTVYTSPNFDAAGTTPGTPKGVSVACLSCHDGTVAFDALINKPGSGGYIGANITNGNVRAGLTFAGAFVDADGSFKEGERPPTGTGAEPFPNLGTNLSNDHPISMEIPATDPQFAQILANIDGAALTAGHISPLYRTAASTLPTDKRDRIRAYPTAGDGKAYIECASCHNPHEATSTRFLRYPSFVGTAEETAIGASTLNADRNAGSLLCLSCHQK